MSIVREGHAFDDFCIRFNYGRSPCNIIMRPNLSYNKGEGEKEEKEEIVFEKGIGQTTSKNQEWWKKGMLLRVFRLDAME
ncbi:MAG: hypothetical protein ACTSUE_10575 [Promethearchaeota archaeon]